MEDVFVRHENFSQIDVDNPFFDSFKKQYINFRNWFRFLGERKAWIVSRDDRITAFLYLEEEEDRLNMSRLKIASHQRRITELFLKLAFDRAVKEGFKEIVFTAFPGTDERILKKLEEFGFLRWTRKANRDDVFVKQVVLEKKPGSGVPQALYYPSFYDGLRVRKFIIPLKPSIHKGLFPDTYEDSPILFESAGQMLIRGNRINKAFIFPPGPKFPLPGDILLFYRSSDIRALTTLGIVDEPGGMKDARSLEEVYLPGERELLLEKTGRIIRFKQYFHFPHYVEQEFLTHRRIVKGSPHQPLRLDHRTYEEILLQGGIPPEFRLKNLPG